MKELNVTVSVDECNDYIGDVDISVEMEDEMFDTLFSLLNEYNDRGEEFSELSLAAKLPEIYNYLNSYVDEIMPDEITLEEDEDIDDFSWHILFPDDMCEWIDCY